MIDFNPAYEAMIINEGGYQLHTEAGDRGGMTYAGISRKHWPDWTGWQQIDRRTTPADEMVRQFYWTHFWQAARCDAIKQARIARLIFDFAVNAGVRTAVILAQAVVGATPDGQMGAQTLAAINAFDAEKFALSYTLAKIARYRDIVTRDRDQQKFLLGWVNRALKEAA